MTVALPTTRSTGCPFDPPAGIADLRARTPIVRMKYPDGHDGWLVTSHELVRDVLADKRFSARAELHHLPYVRGGAAAAPPPQPAPPGVFTATDPPEHTRYRHLLTGQFTVRRMRALVPRIQQVAEECLDAMERTGPPVDLVAAYAKPIPAMVICELLGVPYADRDRFVQDSSLMMNMQTPPQEVYAAMLRVQQYLQELVTAKRAAPTDDLLGGLTTSDLTDEELTNIGFTLLGAGHETTMNMLALGAFALIENPDQLAVLRSAPLEVGTTEPVVEELLRYLSIIPYTVRTALEDVDLHGAQIRKGETVTVHIPGANRDPAHFPDPDVLDLHRHSSGHVAFGHGIHQCLGQQLARMEMQVGFPALFNRFPQLRLAVPPAEIPTRDDMIIYGVHKLPVTW